MKKILLISIGLMLAANSIAQTTKGFQKDSLQIKVYAVIGYEGVTPKSIEVTKIFCEYCNEEQSNYLKKEAWKEAYRQRYDNLYKVKNGKVKLALFLRVHREEFKKLKKQ